MNLEQLSPLPSPSAPPRQLHGGMMPKFSVAWAMPSRWTFQIPPVADLLERWGVRDAGVVVDPFCGQSTIGTHRNDLGAGGVDAEEFVNGLLAAGVIADVVLFDQPYSPRQISDCYKGVGREVGQRETQSGGLYKRVRNPLRQILRPGGIAISFGWNSTGFGRSWPTEEILLVQHGGAHNDTICVVQRKPVDDVGLFSRVDARSSLARLLAESDVRGEGGGE